MSNINQYAAIFAAAGVKLNYDSHKAELEVPTLPSKKEQKEVVKKALDDIDKCDNTANYEDGAASIVLADTIDGEPNPLDEKFRSRVLTALGIMKEGKFVSQYLSQQKTNRSWHTSEEPNTCSYFGEACTHRGIVSVPGKRGRKSTRKPEEYHPMLRSGVIAREQFVPQSLEVLVDSIPADNLISDKGTVTTIKLHKMDAEELQKIKEQVEARLKEVSHA